MRRLRPSTLLPALCLFCLPAFAQEPSTPNQPQLQMFAPNPCAWLPTNIPHADALAGVCQFATSLPQRMPNFICDQAASRYWGKNSVPFDLVTASVRYEDGRESYTEIQVNGRLAPQSLTQAPGLWSTGQFGSNLRSSFDTNNQALFEFARESTWKKHAAWVFSYRIVKQNNQLWRLSDGKKVLAPPYTGELWVDQKTGQLLRFGSVAVEIPKNFSIEKAELQIDYADVDFADGSSFVLPADFTATSALRGQPLTRNVVEFRNCHKFRAKSRMVLNLSTAGDSSEASATNSADSLKRELEENNQIYAILREQAVREDTARMESEWRAEMNVSTVGALWRLAALEKQRQKNVALVANAAIPPPPSTKEDLAVLKVSVKLVPVSVVLRDARGNAIGNLRKDDFQLFDDGKPQLITNFSVEKSGAAERQTPENNSASPGATLLTQHAPPAAARNVAYIFDDIHSDIGDLAQAGNAALSHFDALTPEDRAAIFTTSGEIVLDFTANRETLRQTLRNLRQHPAVHGSNCPPMTEYMADLIVNHSDLEALGTATQDALNCAFAGMKDSYNMARAEEIAKSAAFEMVNASSAANQSTLSVLQQVVRRTEAAPGSRSIVLVSPGFLTLTPETRQSIAELVDEAVRANIVVHTLDVRGLYTTGQDARSSHLSNSVYRLSLDREEALTQGEVMAELAYGTGGTYFHNNNDLNEGFRRTADAPEYVYVLGFSPQKLDGKFHKLKVRLTSGQKLTVQARSGYLAPRPDAAR